MSQLSQQVQQHVPQAKTYDVPHTPAWQFHMAGGALLAVVGFILMLTGALAGVGVVLLSLGVLYCVSAFIISVVQGTNVTTPR